MLHCIVNWEASATWYYELSTVLLILITISASLNVAGIVFSFLSEKCVGSSLFVRFIPITCAKVLIIHVQYCTVFQVFSVLKCIDFTTSHHKDWGCTVYLFSSLLSKCVPNYCGSCYSIYIYTLVLPPLLYCFVSADLFLCLEFIFRRGMCMFY